MDIGIVFTPIVTDALNRLPIYEEEFVLFYASKEIKEKVQIEDLNMDKFWSLEEGYCMRTQVLEICHVVRPQLNTTLNINYKAGSIDSLIAICKIK